MVYYPDIGRKELSYSPGFFLHVELKGFSFNKLLRSVDWTRALYWGI